jgi:hypothetical protein
MAEATLYFFRKSTLMMGAAIPAHVDINGAHCCHLSDRSCRVVRVAPGTLKINAHQMDFQFGQESFEVTVGELCFWNHEPRNNDFFFSFFFLTPCCV